MIFQSDIRRALAHFGQAPFFRYFNRQEAAGETIEEVVVAATMLSAQKTGAIVAIEREIGLRNYIESGIPLDAELTYDLLVTIFQPGSPLHDGAVVLQEDRVAAAACFLPLTVNPRVSRELGTRHRAAIGLTEESDAAAVVVSEETGQIALALDGRIERGLTADQLRERLRSLIMQRRAGRRSSAPDLRRASRQWPITLSGTSASKCSPSRWRRCSGSPSPASTSSSEACACRSSSGTSRRSSRSPAILPTTSMSACAGPRPSLAGSIRERSSPCVDLTGGRPGSRLFHLRNDEVRAPFGVEVAQVLPSTVSLELEKSATRVLPVVPAVSGEPAPGFVVGRRTAEPATVKVIGPESRVRAAGRSHDRTGQYRRAAATASVTSSRSA